MIKRIIVVIVGALMTSALYIRFSDSPHAYLLGALNAFLLMGWYGLSERVDIRIEKEYYYDDDEGNNYDD